jgi:phage terminase large subunit-like protein
MWDLSCRDWEARLREGRPPIPDLPLFREEADMAVRLFNALRLPDVPGLPTMRDAAGDWFRDIVAAVFGSVDPETRERWIREFFVLVGKGNSKTTNSAGLMLVAMLMIPRPRAEYLFVGPTQAISDLAYAQAVGMIEADAALRKRFHVRDHLKEIVDRVRKSKLKVKTFDLNILTGPRPVGVLIDELHLLGKHPATAKVLAQIRGGMEKSPESFLIIVTTQSDEPPAGAFREELNYARGVRDGRIQGRTLPILYEFPDSIARSPTEWQRPDHWPMVMPNLGRSLQLPSLLQAWQKAKDTSLTDMQVWASQHLNIEVGLGLKSDRWRGTDHWEAAAEPGLTFEAILDRCEVVVAGIDGGGLDDLLGFSIIGRERETRRWLTWSKAWVHQSAVELRKSEESRFRDFVQQGDLVIVDNMVDAFADVAQLVLEIHEADLLHKIGLDPMGVGAVIDAIAETGIPAGDVEGTMTVGISQGVMLNGCIKDTEVKLANRTLAHAAQPLMSYAVGNAKAEPKGNAVTINKAISGAGKIDPLMALFACVALMRRNPEAMGGTSVYDEIGGAEEAQSGAHETPESDDLARFIDEDEEEFA